MKRRIPHIVPLAIITGFLAIATNITHAQTTDPLLADPADQSVFPQITTQPLDQVVPIGSNVVLSVQANNADSCQWLRNRVPLVGQTNNVLFIANAGINDVGLYSCEVFKGYEMVPTRAASVQVEAGGVSVNGTTASSSTANTVIVNGVLGGGPITVFGTPYAGSGGQGTCPGPYVGYVAFTKTVSQGWGWAPISGATVLTAADGSGRTDTKVEYVGAYGDHGCNQTTVTIPYPPFSPVYRFTIYFTNNVPTNSYPITLTGFNP
jgi:Immunoglobulin domain